MSFENGYLINIVIRSRFIESECRKHDDMPFPSKYSISITLALNQSAFAPRCAGSRLKRNFLSSFEMFNRGKKIDRHRSRKALLDLNFIQYCRISY